jgi:ribosomal protein S27AE
MSLEKESAMELRCPDCASPEVTLIDRGTRLECGNCGAEFVREEAFVSVADADAYAAECRGCNSEEEEPMFRFDLRRACHSINDPNGAIWPVNSFTDADELNGLFEAAVHSGIIASPDPSGYIHIYPLSISEPEPIVAINRSNGPSLLGCSLKLRERDGESPLEFTLRLLEEIVGEANALIGDLEASR